MYKPLMYDNAELYDMNCGIPKSSAEEALQKYFKEGQHVEKSRTGRVLDVACGQGAVTQILRSTLGEDATIDSTDISNEVLDYAKKKYLHLDVNFIQMDALSTVPVQMKNSYDFVFSNFLFHWVSDHRTLLKNFLDALKDGGDCLICFFSHYNLWSAFRIMAKKDDWSKYMADYKNFMPVYHDDRNAAVNFKQVMLECGFKNVNTEVRDMLYDNGEDYAARIAITTVVDPFLKRIPTEKKDKYVEDFMDIMIEKGTFCDYDPKSYVPGSPVKARGTILIAFGTK